MPNTDFPDVDPSAAGSDQVLYHMAFGAKPEDFPPNLQPLAQGYSSLFQPLPKSPGLLGSPEDIRAAIAGTPPSGGAGPTVAGDGEIVEADPPEKALGPDSTPPELDVGSNDQAADDEGPVVASQTTAPLDLDTTLPRLDFKPTDSLGPAAPRAAVSAKPSGPKPSAKPGYGDFPRFYANWSKKVRNAPPLVPGRAWKQYVPDPAHMRAGNLFGPYDKITFHHTGSDVTPQEVEQLQRGHEPLWHWMGREIKEGGHAQPYNDADVDYHFLIGADGKIYEGRSLAYEGAHVLHHDPRNIGIAFLGDYTNKPLSSAQVHSAKALVHALNDAYGVSAQAGGRPYVYTHGEWDSKKANELGGAKSQVNSMKAWSLGPKK